MSLVLLLMVMLLTFCELKLLSVKSKLDLIIIVF